MSCLPAPITVAPAPHRPLPERYCPVPERLLHDLHDTPFAVGVYALIGRLYLINQLPIALSRADIARFDPAAKPGAITRAFDRLVARGWLLVDTQGCKHRYTPSWGMVRGVSVPWIMGVERLGRPHHLRRLPRGGSVPGHGVEQAQRPGAGGPDQQGAHPLGTASTARVNLATVAMEHVAGPADAAAGSCRVHAAEVRNAGFDCSRR